jgi:hypothetical protein
MLEVNQPRMTSDSYLIRKIRLADNSGLNDDKRLSRYQCGNIPTSPRLAWNFPVWPSFMTSFGKVPLCL